MVRRCARGKEKGVWIFKVDCIEANQKVNMNRGGCSERGQMKRMNMDPVVDVQRGQTKRRT